jgi:hypothetical protein
MFSEKRFRMQTTQPKKATGKIAQNVQSAKTTLSEKSQTMMNNMVDKSSRDFMRWDKLAAISGLSALGKRDLYIY